MAFSEMERWYFSTPIAEAKTVLTDELELPCEFDAVDDEEITLTISGPDRAALEGIFSILGIPEPTVADQDGKSVTFPEYEFVFQLLPDWDGPFE